jgi:oligopeptide transport system ATP-binding protein
MEVDFVEEPPFFEVSPTHKAKTWLLDPRAPKVEKPEIIQNLHEKILDMVKDGGTYGKHGGLLND